MKLYRTILKLAVAVLAALSFVSCTDPFDFAAIYQEKKTCYTYWYLANDTGQKVYFRVSDNESLTPILLYRYPLYYIKNRDEEFYGFDALEPGIGGNSMHIFTDRGNVRSWWADEKGNPGKQFFNEAYWELEIADGGISKIWTFHIEPEDIQ